jgi:hypothetical protein
MSQFKRRITLGSFKIRESKSYLYQLIKNGTIYLLNEKQINKHVNSEKLQLKLREMEVIAVLIVSRHKRGKKSNKNNTAVTEQINYTSFYKVFIQYKPTDEK